MTGGNSNDLGGDGGGTCSEFCLYDRLDVVDADEDVLGFEIGVDDSALVVQVVESEQDLFGDLLDNMLGHTTMLVAFDQAEQVFSQNLKHHTDVGTVGAGMPEVVQKADDVTSASVRRGGVDYALEELDLVESSLSVVTVRLDDLERDVTVCSDR